MNTFRKIGKYEFDMASVIAVVTLNDGNAEVYLPSGVRLILTPEEKKQLDKERERHVQIMQIYGAAKSAGLRG